MKPTERYQLELREYRQALDRQWRRGLPWVLGAIGLLVLIFLAQARAGTPEFLLLHPQSPAGALGILSAPLLHGDLKHLVGNLMGVGVLGLLAATLVPNAALRALPLIWLLAGIGTWVLGRPESGHLGASGITHGLAFFLFVQLLRRRDTASLGGFGVAFFLFGGMLLTVFPREWGVSWEYHLSGALAGLLAAFLFHGRDAVAPQPRYSWDDDEAEAQAIHDPLEPPRPDEVPVLWHRAPVQDERRGVVLRFPPRADDQNRSG